MTFKLRQIDPVRDSFEMFLNGYDENSGLYFEIERVKQLLSLLKQSIKTRNNEILNEVELEEIEVKMSMLRQIHYDNSLSYFENMLYTSFLTSTYALLENRLKLFCKLCSVELNVIEFRRTKTHISDIDNYIEYLKTKVGIETSALEKDTSKIDEYRQVRKYITHNSTEKMSKELRQIIAHNSELTEKYGELYISSEKYIIDLCEITISLFGKIFNELSKKYQFK